MWAFCLRSFVREYGWSFLHRISLPHPIRTTKAFLKAGALDISGNMIDISSGVPTLNLRGEGSIVGVGFCMKPKNPPCISGRSDHDCHYLEHLLQYSTTNIPECCRICTIREIGLMTLQAGAAFYIMTSAQHILNDVFIPALDERRFAAGLFVLCRYSLRPFAVGMIASGIRGLMFPYENGDCRDYKTWLRADRGIKEDQTEINESNQQTISRLLIGSLQEQTAGSHFERQGNILYSRIHTK